MKMKINFDVVCGSIWAAIIIFSIVIIGIYLCNNTNNESSNPLLKGKKQGVEITEEHNTDFMVVENHIDNCIQTDDGFVYITQGRFPNLTGKKIAFGGHHFIESKKITFLEGEKILSQAIEFPSKFYIHLSFMTPSKTVKFKVGKRYGNGQMFLLIETNGQYDVYPVSDPQIYY